MKNQKNELKFTNVQVKGLKQRESKKGAQMLSVCVADTDKIEKYFFQSMASTFEGIDVGDHITVHFNLTQKDYKNEMFIIKVEKLQG